MLLNLGLGRTDRDGALLGDLQRNTDYELGERCLGDRDLALGLGFRCTQRPEALLLAIVGTSGKTAKRVGQPGDDRGLALFETALNAGETLLGVTQKFLRLVGCGLTPRNLGLRLATARVRPSQPQS